MRLIAARVVKKYKEIPLPAKASLWFVICGVIQKGLAFITTPIFSRVLTKEEYGVVSIYMSWMAIIQIVASLELATGVFNRAMIKYEDDRDGYTSSTLFLASSFTVLCYVFYLLFREYIETISGLSFPIITLMFLDIFFTTAITFWTVRERFEYEYKSVVIYTVVSSVIATAVSLAFVLASDNHRDNARIIGLVLPHIAFYSIILIKLLYKGKKLYVRKYWKYAIRYNLPLIPHYLSQQVLNQSDRIMIYKICGSADAAVYALSYQLAIVINIVVNSIHASFMPWTFQKLRDGKSEEIGRRALQIELLIGTMCLIFALFAPELVRFLGGNNYFDAVYIIPPVSMSVLFVSIYSFFGNIEFYFEKTKIVMYASCIVAGVNILLNWIFIQLYGFLAAGYTTLFCYIVYALFHYLAMIRICKQYSFNNPYNGKAMWLLALAFACISIVISFFYKLFVMRYVIIMVLALALFIFYKRNINSIMGR